MEQIMNELRKYDGELRAENANQMRLMAEACCEGFNKAYEDGDAEGAMLWASDAEVLVVHYNSLKQAEAEASVMADENPMVKAATVLEYQTISAKERKPKDGELPTMEIVEGATRFKLSRLYKKDKRRFGADPMWIHMLSRFGMRLAACAAIDIGEVNPITKKPYAPAQILERLNDSMYMTNLAKDIALGNTPLSRTQMSKAMQEVVTAMLGDGYRVSKYDLNFLERKYASASNREALKLVCSSQKKLEDHMLTVLHKLVTGGTYGIDFKKARNK